MHPVKYRGVRYHFTGRLPGCSAGDALTSTPAQSAEGMAVPFTTFAKEGANKQVISSQADSLIKISRIWADF
ncbi:hypothetical protein ACM56O_29340, partial [Klebsiella grimontii]